MLRYLCTLAGVSRSGYYAWLHQSDKHLEKERNDETDYEWIQEILIEKKNMWWSFYQNGIGKDKRNLYESQAYLPYYT